MGPGRDPSRVAHAAPTERFQSIDAVIAALENKRGGQRMRSALAGLAVAVVAAIAWPLTAPLLRANSARGKVPAENTQAVAGSGRGQAKPAPTSGSQSEDLLLRGSIQLRHATLEDNRAAIRLLEQAVSIDPNFAAAHAELARAYGMRVAWFAPDDKDALERAEVAEAKALRLNPDLPEAHHAAGELLWTAIPPRFAHERAAREHLRAIALNPDFADAHHALGMIYQHIGLLDLAMAEYRKATQLDPTTQNPTRRLAMALVSLGEYEEGLRTFRQVPPEANSSVWHYELAWTLLYLGRRQEAWKLMEGYLQAHPEDRGGVVTSTRAIWFASAGDAGHAEADIHTAIEKGKGFVHFHHTAYNIASAYALLGRADLAMQFLRTAADGGWPCYPHFANDPNLTRIRADDRFIAFMNELKKQWERYRAMF
jgi:tetratricopeptide (TPR) repeat protein